MRTLPLFVGLVPILAAAVVMGGTTSGAEDALPARLRRPAALAVSPDGKWLYVANRRSGTLSIVDLTQQQTVGEVELGGQLADVARIDGTRLLAVDEARHQLVLLRATGQTVEILGREQVSPYPVEAIVTQDGRRAFVSSLWSRRLTEVAIGLPGEPKPMAIARTVDLSFAPRKLLLVKDETRLLVGDAFVGRFGVFDAVVGRQLAVREFPAHHIRGMGVAPGGKMLAVAHQMLNELAHTVQNDIHWGMLMSNDLRWLSLDAVLDPEAELYAGAHMHPLGSAGRGGADPTDLAVVSDGLMAVTLGGANQVALGREPDFTLRRVAVGRRPTAVAFSPDEQLAYVANGFDDSISVIDMRREERVGDISLGPQAELTLADRGEMLFYDGRLSHDQWMSCHSCHTDGHANGMLNDNFSDASFGSPKRVLSLLGVADTAPFAWNGEAPDLETQIRKSIRMTMQRDEPPTDDEAHALAAFLQTLAPPPGIDELRGMADRSAMARGESIFHAQKCDRCHAPPTYTSPHVYDVGLHDAQGNRRFNPPSLRGVGQRGPYFHDNRAATLEDVFQVHRHQLHGQPAPADVADLVAFLRSL